MKLTAPQRPRRTPAVRHCQAVIARRKIFSTSRRSPPRRTSSRRAHRLFYGASPAPYARVMCPPAAHRAEPCPSAASESGAGRTAEGEKVQAPANVRRASVEGGSGPDAAGPLRRPTRFATARARSPSSASRRGSATERRIASHRAPRRGRTAREPVAHRSSQRLGRSRPACSSCLPCGSTLGPAAGGGAGLRPCQRTSDPPRSRARKRGVGSPPQPS